MADWPSGEDRWEDPSCADAGGGAWLETPDHLQEAETSGSHDHQSSRVAPGGQKVYVCYNLKC